MKAALASIVLMLASTALGAPVRFEAADPELRFRVSVDDGPACETPCVQPVGPGKHRLLVLGDAELASELELGGPAAAVRIEKRRTGRLVLGVALVAVGGGVAYLGTSTLSSLAVHEISGGRYGGDAIIPTRYWYAGLATAVAGYALVATGVTLGFLKMGRTRAVVVRDPPTGPSLVSVGVAPARGGAIAGATLVF